MSDLPPQNLTRHVPRHRSHHGFARNLEHALRLVYTPQVGCCGTSVSVCCRNVCPSCVTSIYNIPAPNWDRSCGASNSHLCGSVLTTEDDLGVLPFLQPRSGVGGVSVCCRNLCPSCVTYIYNIPGPNWDRSCGASNSHLSGGVLTTEDDLGGPPFLQPRSGAVCRRCLCPSCVTSIYNIPGPNWDR